MRCKIWKYNVHVEIWIKRLLFVQTNVYVDAQLRKARPFEKMNRKETQLLFLIFLDFEP